MKETSFDYKVNYVILLPFVNAECFLFLNIEEKRYCMYHFTRRVGSE